MMLTRSLTALRWKAPARVYICSPALFTMKKPSPSMATSVTMPVALIAPLLKFRCVPAMAVPRPIWTGLLPPVVTLGAVPRPKLRLNVGAKIIRFDLYAIEFTFAMLLPITSR